MAEGDITLKVLVTKEREFPSKFTLWSDGTIHMNQRIIESVSFPRQPVWAANQYSCQSILTEGDGEVSL